MYQYEWDAETGGLLLTTTQAKFSKEPRPVYYKELDILGFDRFWQYPKDDRAPFMWAEANNYIYKGRTVAKTQGGSLYTKPEIILLEDPEPDGKLLEFVDVEKMCNKNRAIMENLEQETIQNIYNTYRKYKKKIDIFYVAFSGGKDSIVTLDLVQRALPHDEFKVLFGNTGMEFSDTYEVVKEIKYWCKEKKIEFLESGAEKDPLETWKLFGPPATVTRWCCSVHKTAPQILLLRKLLNKSNFTGMAFVGVRADESLSRSKYKYITLGGKHRGQYSCNAILNWNSAEIFIYIYQHALILNKTYIKGNRRAGCLICPRAAERNEFMNYFCYEEEAKPFIDSIRDAYSNNFTSKDGLERFIQSGGWKARKNGRDLAIEVNYNERYMASGDVLISIREPKTDWKEWIKTIGVLSNDSSPYVLLYQGEVVSFSVDENESGMLIIVNKHIAKKNPDFIKYIKNVFRKSACCIACKECQADCPYGYIDFKNGQVTISDSCCHCKQCHSVEKGCLVYKSLEKPKGGIVMAGKSMSLNSYSHHAPKMEWINQYFTFKNTFHENHSLGSQMYNFFKRFLRDAKLLDETGFSETAKIIDKIGLASEVGWGIIYINLCYAPQIHWYVTNTCFDEKYSKEFLASLMIDAGAKESWTNDIFSSIVRMTELPLGKIGLGIAYKEKNRALSITRNSWHKPDLVVILYSLYKFAEACGDYYQFSLATLLDDTIERDGVSPTRIFGLDRNTMIRILNGLSSNYPDFISASFTLDLDNITLREDKKAEDVLSLF